MLDLPEIDRFFMELDSEFKHPLYVLITGAVAGFIMGNIRPSDDIDFEIRLKGRRPSPLLQEALDLAIKSASKKLGLPAQYTENIAGWSQISLLDYRKRARFYKKIGKIEVKFMAPEHWAIGKLVRYLPLDRKDLAAVLKATGVTPTQLVTVLAKALHLSPLSDRSREFKNHVLDFFENDGQKIWGHDFSADSVIQKFNPDITLDREHRVARA